VTAHAGNRASDGICEHVIPSNGSAYCGARALSSPCCSATKPIVGSYQTSRSRCGLLTLSPRPKIKAGVEFSGASAARWNHRQRERCH
jgi:hypothetical protein